MINVTKHCDGVKPSGVRFRNSLLWIVIVVFGVAALYFGLRLYESFTNSGIARIAAEISDATSHPPSRWIIFSIASVLLNVPFVVLNSFAVGLALSALRCRPLWKYAMAVGVLSEVPRVYLSYIFSVAPTTGILVEDGMAVLGPIFAGYCIEWIFRRKGQVT